MIQTIITFAMLALLAYGLWDFYKRFRKATGTVSERIMAAAYESGTILWSRFVAAIGVGLSALGSLADFLGAPGISAAITKYLDPQVVGLLFIFIAIVTEVVRRRKSSVDPI